MNNISNLIGIRPSMNIEMKFNFSN